jgi:CubicO group peptidase (beta-lactamase class C family)
VSWDPARWQDTLDRLCRKHSVPGASLAVLAGGEVYGVASGVVNAGTGVETTVDSVFQVGSISKAYTTTVLARLIQQGRVELDTRVREVVPEFRLRVEGAADPVTVRHLLAHTSGIDGDFFRDTGRGDGCVARYVAECAELDLVHPVGQGMSYSNAGFVVAGRVIERLTGAVWDAALRGHVLDPLGVTHTGTLPEEMLRYRAAIGHEDGVPVRRLGLPRSIGPAGNVWASAPDVVEFARLHLTDPSLAFLREPQAEVPDAGRPIQRALGWVRYGWDGREVFGHDGETIGQYAYLRVVPDRQVAVALLTNGYSNPLYLELFTELLAEFADLAVPAFTVPDEPADVDIAPWCGTYRNLTRTVTVESRRGNPWVTMRYDSELVDEPVVQEVRLTAVGDGLFADPGDGYPRSWNFRRLADGRRYLHLGGRLLPRVDA